MMKSKILAVAVIVFALLMLPLTAQASTQGFEITISPPSTAGAPVTIRVDDSTGLVAAQAKLATPGIGWICQHS